ncbi:hypothetical protein [Nocardioides sp. Kera G14]|uniref:hypothetical protein n=1 Tax=Nocardioides sp. Kera G14 TaxID=2884264 RepID=UPI001D110F46|nr:hypothetical protein [Nocardioides sp. Kera G14]UDY22794.1 hypothetical protein LH076_12040 [Nocardioides sp. Kera G14]
MTWTSFHSRGEILRDVIDTADRRLDGRLPMDLDGVVEKFDGELDLLCTLQLKWHTRLAGRIERVLMEQPMDLEAGVIAAWHEVADEMPGVRAILDQHLAAPLDDTMRAAMTKAVSKEHILLAVMAGHAAVADDLAATVGARIAERARATYSPLTTADLEPDVRQPTLFERLKSVLAA